MINKAKKNIIAIVRGYFYRIISFFNNNISIGKRLRIFNNSELRIYSNSKCSIGNNVKIDFNTVVSVLKNGNITIADNVGIGSNSMIVCHDGIDIGENTIFGPNIYIYDHDHLFQNNKIMVNEYKTKKVVIGKNCWLGAGCIILKGTTIGDNCIIGAGTLLKGNYPSNSIITNKRNLIIKDRIKG